MGIFMNHDPPCAAFDGAYRLWVPATRNVRIAPCSPNIGSVAERAGRSVFGLERPSRETQENRIREHDRDHERPRQLRYATLQRKRRTLGPTRIAARISYGRLPNWQATMEVNSSNTLTSQRTNHNKCGWS